MSMTTCFVVSYVPFVVSITLVANTVLEVATRGGVAAAAAAAASGQRRHVLVELMSPATLVFAAVFWTVLGVAFYRYTDCCAPESGDMADHKQKQPQQQTRTVSAKRSKTKTPKDDTLDTDDSSNTSSNQSNKISKRTTAVNKSKPSPPPSPEKSRRKFVVASSSTPAAAAEPAAYDCCSSDHYRIADDNSNNNNNSSSNNYNNDDDDDCCNNNNDDDDENSPKHQPYHHQQHKRNRRSSLKSVKVHEPSTTGNSKCGGGGKATVSSPPAMTATTAKVPITEMELTPSKGHAAARNQIQLPPTPPKHVDNRPTPLKRVDNPPMIANVENKIVIKEKKITKKMTTILLDRKKEQTVMTKPNKENVKPIDNDNFKNNNEEDLVTGSKRRSKRIRKRTKKNKQQVLEETTTMTKTVKTTRRTTNDSKDKIGTTSVVDSDSGQTFVIKGIAGDHGPGNITIQTGSLPPGEVLTMKAVTTATKTPTLLALPSLQPVALLPSAPNVPSNVTSNVVDDYTGNERVNLNVTDLDIWYMLNKYVLSVEQMYANGCPVSSPLVGHAVYYRSNMRQKKLNPVAKEFSLETPKTSSAPSSPNAPQHGRRRTSEGGDGQRQQKYRQQKQQQQQFSFNDLVSCVRCSSFFSFNDECRFAQPNRCLYHYGKLVIPQHAASGTYDCCKKSQTSPGCSEASYHVWNGFADGHNGPVSGFVQTYDECDGDESSCSSTCSSSSSSAAATVDSSRRVYGMDCEMCYTECGLEVTKVTLVDVYGAVVYDSLVQTMRPIIDYNTRYSGISEKDFATCASKSLDRVQRDLLRYIRPDTIIVGHGLGTDLLVLRMLHFRVVDTSVLFPHGNGEPYKLSLKTLAARLLKREIQRDYGHDSKEDARAAMDLVLLKLRHDLKNDKDASWYRHRLLNGSHGGGGNGYKRHRPSIPANLVAVGETTTYTMTMTLTRKPPAAAQASSVAQKTSDAQVFAARHASVTRTPAAQQSSAVVQA